MIGRRISFNVAESQSDTPVKRKKEVISFFLRLYNTICDDNSTKIVTDARRLGKPSEDDKKRRPLLITVDSEYTKRKCFSRLYRLKGDEAFSGVSVGHDMTMEERKQTKLLVDKAKEQTQLLAVNDNDASKNWTYKVRGPPWEQHIEKVIHTNNCSK